MESIDLDEVSAIAVRFATTQVEKTETVRWEPPARSYVSIAAGGSPGSSSRSCGARKSMSGPTGFVPVGLMSVWLR